METKCNMYKINNTMSGGSTTGQCSWAAHFCTVVCTNKHCYSLRYFFGDGERLRGKYCTFSKTVRVDSDVFADGVMSDYG